MSFVHGSKTAVYVNGFDMTSFLNSISDSFTVDTAEALTFGLTAKQYKLGLTDATVSAEGLFTGAVGETDQLFFQTMRNRTPGVWNWLPHGNVDGEFGFGFLAHQTAYDIESPIDDIVSVSVEAQSNVGKERTQILHPLTAKTLTGEGVAGDNTDATTGGAGYLQVMEVSGTMAPSIAVKIQHSVDGIAWVDLISFAPETAGNTAQRKVSTGSVNRHTRAIWTITGTTPSFTFFVAFGRH